MKARKRKRNDGRGYAAIFLACCLIFLAAVTGIFSVQQRRLYDQFDQLVTDNLASYTHTQRRQTLGIIQDVQNNLTSIAGIIEKTSLSPEGDWLQVYLEGLSSENDSYVIDYITLDQLREGLGEERNSDWNSYETLLSGEGVISEIRYSSRLDDSYIFAVAEPVLKDGAVIGVLRTRLDAALLTQFVQKSSMFQNVHSLVIKKDGEICMIGEQTEGLYDSTGNVFSSMSQNGIPAEAVAEIQRRLEQETSMTYRFRGSSRSREYFIAADAIGVNDWHIINFVRSPDVLIHSQSILLSVILTGVLLILLTALAGGMIVWLLMRKKRQLDVEQRRYAVLSEFSDTLLFEYDFEQDTLKFTSNALQKLGLKTLTLRQVSDSSYLPVILHPDDRPVFQRILQAPPPGEGEELIYTEARLKDREGRYDWFSCQYKYVCASNGSPLKAIGKLVDITDQRGREQSLIEQAKKDALTELYNKSGEQIIQDRLEADGAGILFMIDLDHFKTVNDTYGHVVGDQLLSRIGAILKEVFGEEDIAARVGGDEFAVLIPGSADPSLARERAEAILNQVAEMKLDQNAFRSLSVSIGIAISPRDGVRFSELYSAADQAMYTVKQTHAGGWAFYQS